MTAPSQNRTNPSEASNGGGWRQLGRAIAGALSTKGETVHASEILRRAARAVEAERAFLVASPGGSGGAPRVLAGISLRADGRDRPSRSTVETALRARDAGIRLDSERDDSFPGGSSVRALRLRTVMFAPVPSGGLRSAALLADSRRSARNRGTERVELLGGFASLLGLWLARACGDRERIEQPGEPEEPTDEHDLVGRSPAFLAALDQAHRAAGCLLPVLIVGESGTGKEGLARLVHRAGARRGGPFLGVNCAAMPESLLENELFGSARGAFTDAVRDHPGLFRLADGGTLLLDEIGDMPLPMQAKLLRVLQERRVRPLGSDRDFEVDVRIIAATHRNLASLVERGAFRADLFYRLAVARIHVPPLRERPEDLPLLVEHLARRLVRTAGIEPFRLLPCALRRLETHAWGGNVRELESVLARSRLTAVTRDLRAEDLDLDGLGAVRPGASMPYQTLESQMIQRALEDSGGNITLTAARIGWSRQKLHRRMRELKIPKP